MYLKQNFDLERAVSFATQSGLKFITNKFNILVDPGFHSLNPDVNAILKKENWYIHSLFIFVIMILIGNSMQWFLSISFFCRFHTEQF